MKNTYDPQDLCQKLIQADTETDLIHLLRDAGYWDRPELWRYYGDVENNWGQSGNQQSLAEAALAEKIVNAIDARLLNECLVRGIDPQSESAPISIRAAIAQFFEGGSGDKMSIGGYIEEWGTNQISKVDQGITLCATGVRPKLLNITIADCGEGQTPDRLPETILSLTRSNKMYVPFVQGQFNQGGTGALRFCGEHNLQLVVSRRNPTLFPQNGNRRDQHWGFTIVRRERPKGGRRNSVYTYLAPIGVGTSYEDHHGAVMSFGADSFAIFPGNNGPYDRQASYGTAIKLYEFNYRGERSNILRGKSLRSRLDLLLPEIALPVRIYEYRSNPQGTYLEQRSRETTLQGLRHRLKNSDNVEKHFPIPLPFSLQGQNLIAHVFAFKPRGTVRDIDERVEDEPRKRLGGVHGYRKNEGVVFVRNGQTHGSLPKDFFRRDGVKMKPLADDLLVFVDCDGLSEIVREDLFMPSRDRLADNDFRSALIDGLGKVLRDCDQLKALRNQRQQERMSDRLKDDRPLTAVLQSLIKNSPNLKTLLQLGQSISSPFNTRSSGAKKNITFQGEFYPSFFKIKAVEYGTPYSRKWPKNQRMRLTCETDAQDDYFSRNIERGQFSLSVVNLGEKERNISFGGPNLRNGIATVMIDLPSGVEIGDQFECVAQIKDSVRSFENPILVTVTPAARTRPGGVGKRQPPVDGDGKKRERPSQLAPPEIERIYRDDWAKHGFDEFTAMKAQSVGYSGKNDDSEVYSFKVNMDNTPLLNEIKQKRLEDGSARNQFLYANILVGLSLLLEDKQRREKTGQDLGGDDRQIPVEDNIERICRALAPFLLALTALGAELDEGEGVEGLEEVG